jgi:hypothetical protein
VFHYTSWHFYAFSGTNLLTRCHSAISLFSVVLCFRKVTEEIFSELDETKAEHPEIYRSFQKSEEETEGVHRAATPPGARPAPGPCPPMVRAPWSTSGAAPSPIKTPRREKPKDPITFLKYIAIRRCRRPKIGRVHKLFPAPCRRGESPPEVFFIAMLAFGVMSE